MTRISTTVEQEDGNQEKKRRRGGATHVERGKRVFPDRVGDRLGRAARPTTGQNVNQVVRLHRGDHADQHRDQQHWHQQRQRDCPERLPAVGAVNRSRFDRVARQCGQPGEDDDDHQ